MARYTDASCRLCRREGTKLFLKGARCYSGKCALERRASAPGQHGQARKKVSEYGVQTREKQKVKRYYGILEKQFRNYFEKAASQEGMAGDNLLIMVERRLDNVAYRMGIGESRREARQLVRHSHFTINGKKANIPSILVKPGDVVAVKEASRGTEKFKTMIENTASRAVPAWLEADKENFTAKVISMPTREGIDFEIEEHLIVELYSK